MSTEFTGIPLLPSTLPYKCKDDHIEGVLITFMDITMRLFAESQTKASGERAPGFQ